MAKKDTTQTIRAMLGESGAVSPRAGARPARHAAGNPVDQGAAHSGATSSLPPPVNRTGLSTARRARNAQVEPVVPDNPPTEDAPRTLRLSQPTANALRQAWLEAKRDDLLLTYQDFADRVVRAGLGR